MPDHPPIQRKKGLKVNNQASSLPPPKVDPRPAFEEQAKQVFEQTGHYKQSALELGTRYKNIVLDKILPENKTVLSKDLEKEVVQKLAELATEMNNDPNLTADGEGSIALSILMMRMMLIQRDIINELAFKLEKTEKTFVKMLAEKQDKSK